MVESSGMLGARVSPDVFKSEGIAAGRVGPIATAASGFAEAMSQPFPEGLVRKASALAPVRELGGPAKALNDLSNYLSGRHQAVVRMIDEAVRIGSPEKMMKVNAAMIDLGAETDLLAKTVGKSVSALDQLTKLN